MDLQIEFQCKVLPSNLPLLSASFWLLEYEMSGSNGNSNLMNLPAQSRHLGFAGGCLTYIFFNFSPLVFSKCTVSILKNLHARMVSLEGLKFVQYTYPLESSTHLVRPTNWIKIKSIGARRGKLNSLWKPPGIELTTLELKTLGRSVIGMKSRAC